MNIEEFLELKKQLENWKQKTAFEKPKVYHVKKAFKINDNDYELECEITSSNGLKDVFKKSFSTSITAYARCNEVDQYIQQCIANAESYKQEEAKKDYLDRYNELIK